MKNLYSSIIVVLFAAFAVAGVVFAFTAPTATPPGGNVDPPLNVSFQGQEKLGGLTLNTGGAPNGLIVAQGNVGIGTINPTSILNIVGANADVRHYSYDPSELNGADYEFMRARGTEASPLPVEGISEQDKIGSIRFKGYEGNDFFTGAQIRARADGSFGTVAPVGADGDVPMSLEFLTRENTISGLPKPLTVRMTISAEGKIGFGTENPQVELEVKSDDANYTAIRITNGLTTPGTWELRSSQQTPNNGFVIYDATPGRDIERFVITSGGNVGINDITPSFKLDVNGTLRAFGITDSSDVRLKKDIVAIGNALDSVLQLRGIHYQWIDEQYGTGLQMGLIGQEVEQIFPEVVDTDEEGFKSIQYGKLTAALIEAIKEQQRQIDQLRAELEELRGQIQ